MSIKLGIILGSGIEIDSARTDSLKVINNHSSGVHKKIRFTCNFERQPILVLQGRNHYYEGYNYEQLTEDLDLIEDYKVTNLIITNAAGGVNDNFSVSDLMLIRSYINLNSSLIYGKKPFPYDSNLSELFRTSCIKAKVMLHEGVYGYYQGPTYETNAEVRFQKKFNIDAAGMSTVPESNEACKRGINVIAISVVTNLLNENRPEPASHESVIEKAKAASVGLNKALSILIPQLN